MPPIDLLYPPCTPFSLPIWQFFPTFPILVSLRNHFQMDFIHIKIDVCWGMGVGNLGLGLCTTWFDLSPGTLCPPHTHTQSVWLNTAHLFHFSHFNSCPISLDLSKTDGSPSWNLKCSMWTSLRILHSLGFP